MRNRDVEKAGRWTMNVRMPFEARNYFEIHLCAEERETGGLVRQLFREGFPSCLDFQEYKDKIEKEVRTSVQRQINDGCLYIYKPWDGIFKTHFFYDTDWWLE